jgi:UDP-2-acetamido-2-deoxy-ribo-hexuluronate aminotransferase
VNIPFVDLKAQYARLKPEIDARIQRVLDHGQFIMGPEVSELETALASHAGARHAIGLSSGSDALLVPLIAAGIGAGHAVFLPSFTFTATAEMVLLAGATPVFVDVEANTFNIDPVDLKQKIKDVEAAGRLQPRAVMAVDLFGLPADYEEIGAIASQHGLLVIADAAQSFGADRAGKMVGCMAEVTATSFFPAKPLGGYGDGGALFTDSDELAALYRSVRSHGTGDNKYDIVRLGLNARLDTLQAAILLAKLEIFPDEIRARRELADYYDTRLAQYLATPPRIAGANSAWAQYTIQCDDRDGLAAALREQGIPSAIYYPRPMHLQPAYAEHGPGDGGLPVSEALADRVLSLPMHPYMSEDVAERICGAVIEAIAE